MAIARRAFVGIVPGDPQVAVRHRVRLVAQGGGKLRQVEGRAVVRAAYGGEAAPQDLVVRVADLRPREASAGLHPAIPTRGLDWAGGKGADRLDVEGVEALPGVT